MLDFIKTLGMQSHLHALTTLGSDEFLPELIKQIKSTAVDVFSRFSSFFNSYHNQSKEVNLKRIAIISFVSLILIIFVSIIRRNDNNFIPPTPFKKPPPKKPTI